MFNIRPGNPKNMEDTEGKQRDTFLILKSLVIGLGKH